MDEWKYKPARDLGLTETQRWASLQRENGLVAWMGRHVWWWWVHGILRLVERVQVEGRENLPKAPPFILVANHASHLDALVMASALPVQVRNSVFPIAAGDVFFETPMIAAFSAAAMNALPIWRKNCGRHAMEELRKRLLEEPCGYILFPEGTRTRTGTMGPFKAGVGMLIAGLQVPVVPCHLSGTYEALPAGKTWPRRAQIRLRIGGALCFSETANRHRGWETVAKTLEEAVRNLSAN